MNPKPVPQEFLVNGGNGTPEGYAPDAVDSVRPIRVQREPPLVGDLLRAVCRERRFIAKALLAGLLLGAVVSLVIPSKYESTTRIMPPERQGLGGLAAMLAATGDDRAGSLVGGIVSNAVGLRTTGALVTGVLRSTTVQDTLVDRFNLQKVYGMRYRKDARERLSDSTAIDEDRKSGIITVTVTDRSPRRATQMAKAYLETLDQLTAQLNTSAAHRERVFIEDRLKAVKQDLDAASKDLSEFSSKNLTLDVREQSKAMVEGAAALAGELVAAESQLSGLEQIYTPNNVRIRALRARVAELKRKLAELRGTSGDPADANAGGTSDFGVSITRLPALGVTYYDLYRRVKIQETVFEILTRQYELAKIEEAKEVPTIKVLDEAKEPETRSSPRRRIITVLAGMLAATMAIGYVMISAQIRAMSASHPLGVLGLEMREGLSEDLALLRRRTPEPIVRIASRLRSRFTRKPFLQPPQSA